MTKMMISAKLPKSVQQKMLEQIIKDGYGMRGKSHWVSEAIERFLLIDNYPELVDIANEMQDMSAIVTIRVTRSFLNNLDAAVVQVRKQYPAMEGVKSSIIRASIVQRLIRD